MDSKEKSFIDGFKSYLSVEKNFSEHTISAYCSDIVSFFLWLNGISCVDIDFNKLREYLHFIQRCFCQTLGVPSKMLVTFNNSLKSST